MLVEHTITRLNDMRLTGMSEAYSSQRERPNINELSFDERFSLMVDHEWTYRQNRRLARLLKAAKLRLPACVEDINYRQPRGLDRNLVVHFATCDWIRGSQNVLITGPYSGRLGNGTTESCGKPRHPGDHRRSQPAVIHDNCQPTPC